MINKCIFLATLSIFIFIKHKNSNFNNVWWFKYFNSQKNIRKNWRRYEIICVNEKKDKIEILYKQNCKYNQTIISYINMNGCNLVVNISDKNLTDKNGKEIYEKSIIGHC